MPPLTDVDECKQAEICGNHAHCTNIVGGFSCTCTAGYRPDNSTLPPGLENLCIGIAYTAPFDLS